jgi:hypothetical protein
MSTELVTNDLVVCYCFCPVIAPLSSPTSHTTSVAVEVPITVRIRPNRLLVHWILGLSK